MNALRLLSWPYACKHKLRSVLTVAGISLGVGLFAGMHTTSQSTIAALNNTVEQISGRSQLQVSGDEDGFDEEVLDKVQALREVSAAAPVLESVARTRLAGEGSLLVLGVDMVGDSKLRDYSMESQGDEAVDDPLVFLSQPDSIIVTRRFAARNGLGLNSRISLSTVEGDKSFTVRGLLRDGGLASAYGGNVAVMDIYAAQKMFGRDHKFDRIDIAVRDGVSVEQCRAAVAQALGPELRVEPPSAKSSYFRSLLHIYTLTVNVSSALALFIAIFLIYNSFCMAVVQRRSEIGLLRSLGATGAYVRTLFLMEGALAGAIGSGAGLLIGVLLARVFSRVAEKFLAGMYGISQTVDRLVLSPALVAVAVAAGIGVSLLAAFLPAREASRVPPSQALQAGREPETQSKSRWLTRLALVCGIGVLVCLLAGDSAWWFYAGYVLAIAATMFLTPQVLPRLCKLMRWPLSKLRPLEGPLTIDSLLRAPRRTAATVCALMFSVAMAIGLGGVARSAYSSVARWVDSALNPDLFVSADENLSSRNFHLPAAMEEQLQQVEGIAEVQPVRSIRVILHGTPVMMIAGDWAKIARTSPRRAIGDYVAMHQLVSEGKGVIISDNLSRLQHISAGDSIELRAPDGLLRLPVVGITEEFLDQNGTIMIGRSTFRQHWHDDSVDHFRVYVRPGADIAAVQRRVLSRFSNQRVFVLSNREVRSYVLNLAYNWFRLTYLQVAIAVLVAIIGVANTLAIAIVDRRRELAMMRAIGGSRGQLRSTLWLEAMTVGALGIILGLVLGGISLFYQLKMFSGDFGGMRLDYVYPWSLIAAVVPIILAASFVAALAPAESAARSSVAIALQYE